jgi:nucleotide-binding universal stress UspA family protein
MFRHLLLPLDGSRLAETVLPAAVSLAQREGVAATLLHVVEEEAPSRVHGDRHLRAEDEARAYLMELRDWLAERGVPADVRVEVGQGDVAARICREAQVAGADLVALCTHGSRGVRGLLFGRVAQQILARGTVPVFLLPPSSQGRKAPFGCRRVLVPLDGSQPSEGVLPLATELARAFDAELVLESVIPTVAAIRGARGAAARLMPHMGAAVLDEEAGEAAAYLEGLAARLEEEGVSAAGVVERGEPVRVLEAAARRHGADVFAMATHGRAGVSAIWEGSVAARLLERSGRPMMLVRITSSR